MVGWFGKFFGLSPNFNKTLAVACPFYGFKPTFGSLYGDPSIKQNTKKLLRRAKLHHWGCYVPQFRQKSKKVDD